MSPPAPGRYSTKRHEHHPPCTARSCAGLRGSTRARCATSTPWMPTTLLIVTTDRLSAFDVVLPDPIPEQGPGAERDLELLVRAHRAPRAQSPHRARSARARCTDPAERAQLQGRAVIVRRLKALPIEAVVRGYLIGSGWKDYQATGALCGIALPAGMKLAQQLPQPLFTPATKARSRRARREHLLRARRRAHRRAARGKRCARRRSRSITSPPSTPAAAASSSPTPSSSSASTQAGTLTLIDEVLTPDSSRFWPADTYRVGTSPPSFDKQFVRDYLETLDWDKRAPGPKLPAGGDRAHQREVPRGAHAPHGRVRRIG